MKYTPFHEERFRSAVAKALQQIKMILDTTRNPRLPEDESNQDHTYDDKYAVAEFVTNTAVASQMNAFERLGLDSEKFQTISDWVHTDKKAVTLRFQAHDGCSFLKEQDVTQTSFGTEKQVEKTTQQGGGSSSVVGGGFLGMGGTTTTETTTTKVISKIKEYHWKIELGYTIVVVCGNDQDSIELDSRSSSTIVITSGGHKSKPPMPVPEKTVHAPVETDMTWFFQMIEPSERICQFTIDRHSVKAVLSCKTPRRNDDVDAAVEFNKGLYDWSQVVQGFFLQRIEKDILGKHNPVNAPPPSASPPPETVEPGSRAIITGLTKEPKFNGKYVIIREYSKEQNRFQVELVDKPAGLPPTMLLKPQNVKIDTSQHGPSLMGVTAIAEAIFCPVVPLMEDGSVLSMGDVGDFLSEQSRSIDEAVDGLAKTYPPRQLAKPVSVAEATVVLMCRHLQQLTTRYHDSVDYVENLLKQQLVQAIGKEINSTDFDQFMVFHSAKLFGPAFCPKPFTYAIRRPNHYPDGILSIENTRQKNDPIYTMARHVPGASGPSIYIPINAATSVEITGDRFLHGWMQHRFKSKPKMEYHLIARARQFSSFLLIIGTMMGPDKFDPKNAIIVQNKDELLIPLLTNVLPSAKEFKDSIASLSPEQKAFAQSFRDMQLESSVFGVCVVQLKPQLEKLLGLPPDALTKEIQLTQDLMSLFIDYQIPSDLLSFDGAADSNVAEKVATVRDYVKSVMDVIDNAKEKQLKEEERKADMRAEMHFTGKPLPPSPPGRPSDYVDVPHEPVPMAEALAFSAELSERSAGSAGRSSRRRPVTAGSNLATENAYVPPHQRGPSQRGAGGGSFRFSKGAAPPIAAPAPTATTSGPSMSVQLETVQPSDKKSVPPADSTSAGDDFTNIPKLLDAKLEKLDTDNALRSTIIKPGPSWTRMRQENLLTPIKMSNLGLLGIDTEKKKAFDLLDAISRSGTLPIDCAELHVVVGVSHCFDNDLMGTIIQDNIDPIEKVEKSSLMIASTIYGQPAKALIQDKQQAQRLTRSFPQLFGSETNVEIYQDDHE